MRGKAETEMMNLLVSRSVLEKDILLYKDKDNDPGSDDSSIKQAARTHFTKFRNTITFIVRIA